MTAVARARTLLGSISILMAALFGYECLSPIADLEIPTVRLALPTRDAVAGQVFQMPTSASFATIDARPVFDATRQPVAAPPEAFVADGTSSSLPPMTLVGIIIDRQTRLALIKLAGAPLAMSYAVGMSVSGWQIVEIEADRIVLRAGGANQEIRLTGKPQTSAPATSDNL